MKITTRIASLIICHHLNTHYNMGLDTAKKCAIVTVDHIINSNPHSNPLNTEVVSTMDFWMEVKREIEKL